MPLEARARKVNEEIEVVELSGELDFQTSETLRAGLVEKLNTGLKHLVLSLAEVGLVDSSGLGALTAAVMKSRVHGVRLSLVVTNPRIMRTFELTGLDQEFPIYGSEREALEAAGHSD